MPTLPPHALKAVTHLIARRMGSAEGEAAQVADHLVRANLAGHDTVSSAWGRRNLGAYGVSPRQS